MTRFQKYKIISPVFCYAFIWIFVALVLVLAWSESSSIAKIIDLSMILSLLFASIYDVFPFFLDLLTGGAAFIRSPWVCYPLLVPILAFFCMTSYFFLAGKWKHHLWRATNLLLSVFMAVGIIATILYLRF